MTWRKLLPPLLALLLLSSTAHAAPHRAPPAPSRSKGRVTHSKKKKKSRKGGSGSGASVAGGIAKSVGGAILGAMVGGMLRLIWNLPQGPRERHTGFLDFGGGYGGLWGVPGSMDRQGSGLFRFRLGYRSRPFGGGGGTALELALAIGLRARSADPHDELDPGVTLFRVGGEARLYGWARRWVQPYLLAGCAHYSLSSGGEQEGWGIQGGGGLQLWTTRHMALDLTATYDAAFLSRMERPVQGLSSSLGLKIYF